MKVDAGIPISASTTKRLYEGNEIYKWGTKNRRLRNEALKVDANIGVQLKRSYLTKRR